MQSIEDAPDLANAVRAIDEDDAVQLQTLIDAGLDPNARDADGLESPLLKLAVLSRGCVRVLISAGAAVDAADDDGWTPLMSALARGHGTRGGHHLQGAVDGLPVAHDLVIAGADVNGGRGADDYQTPVVLAAFIPSNAMIKILLSRGASTTRPSFAELLQDYEVDVDFDHRGFDFLDRVDRAGGWKSYVREPRKRLLALRVLCERGRASTDDALLRRLFPWHAPAADDADDEQRPTLLARAPHGPRELPKEVFWLVFEFWRSARDSRY